ncbi:AraC family transcriptional regulator [Maribacter vaceletii]|uniref:AraC family transcriptional regulator n=1 Tax=Maribacter vaceletii TaxID=1206816 RepID=A0A495E5Q2_9FLAO|nr:GyrI-like domain-containing protein [Maribacter vaceletii]RKR12250.1 AraC family transcriptional regulator [Maribacter vaceletii]
MTPRIEIIKDKKLIGKQLKMSLVDNKTPILWKSFMQQRKEITNTVNIDLYSIQVYNASLDFKDFNPQTEFTKWAAAEVTDYNTIPNEMDSFILPGGMYAVFIHKGDTSGFAKTMQYIFGVWLPQSEYLLDQRPHFEKLGEKYKNNSDESEEEVWIPIKNKVLS